MKESDFWELQRSIGFEFSKYVLSHPEIDEQIPDNALVVFNLEENPEFNEWAIRIANSRREPNQPVVILKAQKLLPPFESRLVNPRVEVSV
ncbi:MAG: hypothetical protein COS11_02225 [bacterium (Candidatus Ratteibacteria) CG01_land_8_20_14_3_00_40_19]|uniref:Uncharacterized protein n=1 Tax=bacterium (Candidatus Ratteibacteria) CG01_land_8_20_14_3_00_40_19 TaxID=2014290 RepID=A0A2M7E9P0_9BACT|nr:MAG: hypothetical protein COS11_02225 [bacterium (Candidatus Ratteibacteria) CG01_land_8_20_14_3_00_40_19]HCG77414.1 hypothetical protein [bacterium]